MDGYVNNDPGMPHRGQPRELYLIEPTLRASWPGSVDAHSMNPVVHSSSSTPSRPPGSYIRWLQPGVLEMKSPEPRCARDCPASCENDRVALLSIAQRKSNRNSPDRGLEGGDPNVLLSLQPVLRQEPVLHLAVASLRSHRRRLARHPTLFAHQQNVERSGAVYSPPTPSLACGAECDLPADCPFPLPQGSWRELGEDD